MTKVHVTRQGDKQSALDVTHKGRYRGEDGRPARWRAQRKEFFSERSSPKDIGFALLSERNRSKDSNQRKLIDLYEGKSYENIICQKRNPARGETLGVFIAEQCPPGTSRVGFIKKEGQDILEISPRKMLEYSKQGNRYICYLGSSPYSKHWRTTETEYGDEGALMCLTLQPGTVPVVGEDGKETLQYRRPGWASLSSDMRTMAMFEASGNTDNPLYLAIYDRLNAEPVPMEIVQPDGRVTELPAGYINPFDYGDVIVRDIYTRGRIDVSKTRKPFEAPERKPEKDIRGALERRQKLRNWRSSPVWRHLGRQR